ncbi:scoloptoxin SSD14-like [Ischnura elegans]|uniref:scoloptoxin SSD14-like n=1 Tax=Ischnura elegans TaxID=197161 RepID=UPI001ED88396|nr:scoloptoxin SSD14-like [Ischnura elegans]
MHGREGGVGGGTYTGGAQINEKGDLSGEEFLEYFDFDREEILLQIQSPYRIWSVERSPTEYSNGYDDEDDHDDDDTSDSSLFEERDLLGGCHCKMASSVRSPRKWSSRKYVLPIFFILLACVLTAVAIYLIQYFTSDSYTRRLVPPNPEVPLPPSPSIERRFSKAAVCSDGRPCSDVGREILAKNGSAVDAAVAAMVCNGVVNCQSMGLGGGFFMILHIRAQMRSYTLDARETAPAAANTKLFKGNSDKSKKGPLAVAVPGEMKGYWDAHKRFGKLPWAEVIQPALDICETGYNMTKHQADSVADNEEYVRMDPTLRELFINQETGKILREGDVVRNVKICNTLRIIAKKGGDELYKGELAKDLARDIKEMGGVITPKDLSDYKVRWQEPIEVSLRGGLVVHTTPLPSSGPLLAFTLSALDAYEFGPASVANDSATITTYHRIVEIFKHAYALRGQLGDPSYSDVDEVMANLTSRDYAEWVVERIRDDKTSGDPAWYGAVSLSPDDHGTAHLSVLAPNGDAVSLTSSINLYFGAGITSNRTGIILNSCMDDFSLPGFENYFGIPPSQANALEPKKRALSSMAPAIILQGPQIDKFGVETEGHVRLVIGASGGTKIPTAISLVAFRHLWLNESIKEAVDASRFHHQLYPMEISYEYGVLDQVIKGLEKIGHKTSRYRERGSIVCAISKQGVYLHANADFRKGGEVDGF